MKIAVIGTGHVASVLSRKMHAAGHTILQVFGRNHLAAAVLADKYRASTCSDYAHITQLADVYVIAVSDTALITREIKLRLANQLVVHTAGAVTSHVLKDISTSYGVLYPLQSIRREMEDVKEIPFLVDANDAPALAQIQQLARSLSTRVTIANDLQRLQYHLCATVSNNFSNYLYVLAETYCRDAGLQFNLLLPLLDETVRRLHHASPAQVQTGPAFRKDTETINRHLALLKDQPELKALYETFTMQMVLHPW